MEPTDLTIKILQEIRDEQRATRVELKSEISGLREEMSGLRQDLHEHIIRTDARFETIESTLKDLAEQMVMLARGIRSALDVRADHERRLVEVERRVDAIEKDPH